MTRWAAVLFFAGLSGVLAQERGSRSEITFASSAEIDAAARALTASVVSSRLRPDDAFQYFVTTRRQAGSAEIHADWTDITMIRSGSGVLRTGHAVTGRRDATAGAGEVRAQAIQAPVERQLSAGDLVVIPAGLAHQFIPAGNQPLVYVTVKAPAGAKR